MKLVIHAIYIDRYKLDIDINSINLNFLSASMVSNYDEVLKTACLVSTDFVKHSPV